MHRNFEDWFKTFRKSITEYDYNIDFHKITDNVEHLKIELSILSTLIGSQNIEKDFADILTRYPECLKAVSILLAVREHEIFCQDENGAVTFRFDQPAQSIEQYTYFMRQTGLFDLLSSKAITNLQSYVTGIEAGLDSNGRKNRGGLQMEKLVEGFLKKSGAEYYSQIYLKSSRNLYAIETNFYTSGGSKLNETARSYKLLVEESRSINGFVFIWITDGAGWNSAKHNLEEVFNSTEHIYNISDIESGVLLSLFTK